MTAPPAEKAAVRASWAARLGRVDSHLTQAYVHRDIWQAVRDEIVRVNPSADGGFLASYTQVYAEALMTTIRRIADKDPATDSLWATWEKVRRNPGFASRQEYIDLAVAHEWKPIRPHVTEFHVIDLDLDVVSTADRGVFIDDEDEFEDHRTAMNYPAALAESLEASAAELFQAVKAQEAPFDGTDVGWFTKGRI